MANPPYSRGRLPSGARLVIPLLCALLWSSQGGASAQEEGGVSAALEGLLSPADFELTPEQRQRFERYLPHALAKLEDREPFHVIAIGDSVTRFVDYTGHEADTHRSYEGVFAAELAKLFFYTGSVRDLRPEEGQPSKVVPAEGPEVTIENMGLGGRVSLHAFARITTDAFVNKPSIMTISYGINDAFSGLDIGSYLRAFRSAAEAAKANDCDPIFVAPSTVLGEELSDLTAFARTRPYAAALAELADEMGVLFVDFGAITASGPPLDEALGDAEAIAEYNRQRTTSYHTHDTEDGGEVVDPLHPSEDAQRELGRFLYHTLLEAPATRYRVGGFSVLDGAGGVELRFKVKNLTDADQSGRLLLAPIAGLAPAETSLPFDLRAGKGAEFVAHYKSARSTASYHFDSSEPYLRFPMLVADRGGTFPLTVSAAVTPVIPVWEFGSRDGMKTSLGGEFVVVAAGVPGAPAVGAGGYQARWCGRETSGEFRAGTPTGFSFPLPGDGADRQRGELEVDLIVGGKPFRFSRGMEASRNFGIGEELNLLQIDRDRSRSRSEVTLTPDAGEEALILNFEIERPLRSAAQDKSPYYIEFQIDARPYGERRAHGFTDYVRLIPEEGGETKIGALRQAVFGDGYSRRLDRAAIGVVRQPLAGGGEKVTVTVPRSFFYRHEWALGNGNSLLGFNAWVYTQSDSATPEMPYPADGIYQLVAPGLNRFDPQSLAVLELAERPTSRWSVRVY